MYDKAKLLESLKAGANGVPNFSVLDGWWEGGFNGANG